MRDAEPGGDLCADHLAGWRATLAHEHERSTLATGAPLTWIGVAALHARWLDRVSRLGGIDARGH